MAELVCTFTANVNCLTCHQALLATWRADDPMSGAVKRVFQDFRAVHIRHPGFLEGLPGMGMHQADDTVPSGRTLLNEVRCEVDPDHEGHLRYGDPGKPIYYST